MKLLLSLTTSCLVLVLCHGFCTRTPFDAEIKDGQLVVPKECTDPKDMSKHPYGSTWESGKCTECSCSEDGMECCTSTC